MKFLEQPQFLFLAILIPAFALADPPQLGVVPIPVVQNISIQTSIIPPPQGQFYGLYTYTYTVTNPANNTGSIRKMLIDMKAPLTYSEINSSSLTLPRGGEGGVPFDTVLQQISNPSLPINFKIIAFGITAPTNWIGTLTVNGTGGWASADGAQLVVPGESTSGFSMISTGVPTIKMMQLYPNWILDLGSSSDPTQAQEIQALQVQQSLVVAVPVLAPSSVTTGTLDQWDELQNDLNTAISLGWVSNPALAQTLKNRLQTARADMDAGEWNFTTVQALNTLLATVTSAAPDQLTQDGYNLLDLNITAMLTVYGNQTPPQPQQSPKLTITNPASLITTATVGSTVTVTAQVVDQDQNDAVISNYNVVFNVDTGPNAGISTTVPTDSNGDASISYTGQGVGTDSISALLGGPASSSLVNPLIRVVATNTASIIWTGGPDLIVSEFTPPLMNWDGHSVVHITDTTKNIGNTSIGASTTIYYLSSTTPVDPQTAIAVGSRAVPALTPDEQSFYAADYTFPSSVSGPGQYYLTACANGNRAVAETNYNNNCEVREIAVEAKKAIMPPECSNVGPTIASIWPPNHKMVTIGIAGVTDPNNLSVTILITGIQQDEPVEEPGSGNTDPDGAGVGTSTAQVRAERSGTGTGRIYFIGFNASDSAGGSCAATVQVYVPHDQGQGTIPIDTGQRYDSTQ